MSLAPELEPLEQRLNGLPRLRWMREIAELDLRREIRSLHKEGVSQSEIARRLGVSQPAVNALLKRASEIPEPREGFSGASPAEICQRYAAGALSRDQVIDELSRWDYEESAFDDEAVSLGLDDASIEPDGTFQEVIQAADQALISGEIYDQVMKALSE